MMIYLRCIAGSQAKTTTTKTTTKINSALHFIVKFIYQKSFFFRGRRRRRRWQNKQKGKAAKSINGILPKILQKSACKQKGNTVTHTDTHTHMCTTNYESKQKAALKMQTQKFQRKRQNKKEKNDRKTAKCGKINVAFLLHFVPLFYAAAAVCELLAANCSHVCVWGVHCSISDHAPCEEEMNF